MKNHLPNQGISLRGSTYNRVKAFASSQGLGTSELVQRWLAKSPAITMVPIEEYKMLETLSSKRSLEKLSSNDLFDRMEELWAEMSEPQRRLLEPPPKPRITHQPVAEDTSLRDQGAYKEF